jgi:hypothetical protein
MRSGVVDLGYESYNSLMNLGSVFVFACVYFMQVALVGLVTLGRFVLKRAGVLKEGGKKEQKKSTF